MGIPVLGKAHLKLCVLGIWAVLTSNYCMARLENTHPPTKKKEKKIKVQKKKVSCIIKVSSSH